MTPDQYGTISPEQAEMNRLRGEDIDDVRPPTAADVESEEAAPTKQSRLQMLESGGWI